MDYCTGSLIIVRRRTMALSCRWIQALITLLLFSTWSTEALQPPLTPERFSVAPMMAHTNRHYHTFFRFISQQAHLYTEMIPAETIVNLSKNEKSGALQELLAISSSSSSSGPIVLQLGGRDPAILARAAQLGVEAGYHGINLNCGCPSNAVSGRSGGCALMRTPALVAECVERMSEVISNSENPSVELSVKHRLGVREASTYNAEHDKQQNDDEAFQECEEFIEAITQNSNVRKLQVHARLGLLGEFEPERTTTLWTPDSHKQQKTSKKVDHKREQLKAKKRSRRATIQNRSVPPLRPNVVTRLAEHYPHLDLVTNGGIQSIQDLHHRIDHTPIMGAMVGRSVINHPCSFSHVDGLWGQPLPTRTRHEVLQAYIQYCTEEEERQALTAFLHIETLRRRLVAVPFSLFAGEEGNNAYQRTIRKLIGRANRHSAAAILKGALSHVPEEVLHKHITEFSPLETIQSYSHYNPRSGPLQRAIM